MNGRATEPERLVTVATYVAHHEASLALGRLEACDIPAFLVDQYAIGVSPLYSNALGGIKLQVFAAHAEEARALLLAGVPDGSVPEAGTAGEEALPNNFVWLYLGIAAAVILTIFALKTG